MEKKDEEEEEEAVSVEKKDEGCIKTKQAGIEECFKVYSEVKNKKIEYNYKADSENGLKVYTDDEEKVGGEISTDKSIGGCKDASGDENEWKKAKTPQAGDNKDKVSECDLTVVENEKEKIKKTHNNGDDDLIYDGDDDEDDEDDEYDEDDDNLLSSPKENELLKSDFQFVFHH